jgi:predicted Zn-dependent protease
MLPRIVFIYITALFCAANLCAHDSPLNTIERLSTEISKYPDGIELYIQRGDLYRLKGFWDDALSDFTRAAELDPDREELNLYIGRSLLGAGKPGEARHHFDTFLDHYPDNSNGLELRADASLALGDNAAAESDLENLIATSGQSRSSIYLKLARLQARKPPYSAALKTIDAGVAKAGPDVSLIQLAIDLELKSKNYDAALGRLNTLPEILQRTPEWLVTRGDILRQAGRSNEAQESYQAARQAISRKPETQRQTPAILELQKKIERQLVNEQNADH